MQTHFITPYKILISLCAISVGMMGFGLGSKTILSAYSLTLSNSIILIGFVLGIILMVFLYKWRKNYDDLINGRFSLWPKVIVWCLLEGFSLSFIVIPFGAILTILMRVVGD
jgi:ABC-type polysaccharide transport system permease subunit